MIDSEDSYEARLQKVQDSLSDVHHDLKNPLSVIDGNAQFVLELKREFNLDDEIVASVEDIYEAAERLRASLDRLAQLREELETTDPH